MKKIACFLFMLSLSGCGMMKHFSYEKVEESPLKEESGTTRSIVPIFSQKLRYSIPKGWHGVYENTVAGKYILEFVPEGESVKQWSQMITILGLEGAAGRVTPYAFIASIVKRIKSVCGESLVFEPIGESESQGYVTYEAIMGCAEVPVSHWSGLSKGQSEIAYYRVIQGEKDLYSVQKALRGAAFLKSHLPVNGLNYHAFIKDILPIELCGFSGEASECIP